MPKENSVTTQFTNILCEQLALEPEDIKPTSRFIEDLNADTLDTIEIIMAVEEELSIDIQEDETDSITTVGEAIAYIEKKLGVKS